MAHKKGASSSRNGRESNAQRLGVKRFGGQAVREGEVIVRQIGRTKIPGTGTFMSRNFTIHAAKDGVVSFKQRAIRKHTGKTTKRTEVVVE